MSTPAPTSNTSPEQGTRRRACIRNNSQFRNSQTYSQFPRPNSQRTDHNFGSWKLGVGSTFGSCGVGVGSSLRLTCVLTRSVSTGRREPRFSAGYTRFLRYGDCLRRCATLKEDFMKRLPVMLAAFTAALLAAPTVIAQEGSQAQSLRADLKGLEEVPLVSTPGRGTFRARVVEDGTALEYTLKFENLQSDVTQAHIHQI